jgi:hypothetical protein
MRARHGESIRFARGEAKGGDNSERLANHEPDICGEGRFRTLAERAGRPTLRPGSRLDPGASAQRDAPGDLYKNRGPTCLGLVFLLGLLLLEAVSVAISLHRPLV